MTKLIVEEFGQKKMTKLIVEEFGQIKNLRHQLHVENDISEYNRMVELLMNDVYELRKTNSKLPRLEVETDNELWCDREDCSMEDCPHCEKLEQEWMEKHKESNNSTIEEWMYQVEEVFGFEENSIAPTGMARHNWVVNYR